MPVPATLTRLCSDCGSLLVDGACATCAFSWLRSGHGEPADRCADDAVVGRYRLLECLARGGMGVVYAARDTELNRTVALKVLRGAMFAGPGEIARFTLETQAAAALDHPHIVPVYEVGQEDGEPFFTMKLIDGETLAARLRRGAVPAREAAALLVPICRAVDYAHGQGVLHRDLKPGNIMVDAAGKPWLADFGLAKFSASDSGLTRSTDSLGTPQYMSPEMTAGRVSEFSGASDVWALGVILWEMVTGTPPFTGQSPLEILHAVQRDAVPPRPERLRTHWDVLTIAQRCMEKSPSSRIASAGLVADELERFLRGESILSRPAAPAERLVKWMRRRPLHAALLALGLAFLVVSSVLWMRAENANTSLTQSNDRLGESLRRSKAIRLAGEARLHAGEHPERALLLAAAAAEMHVAGAPVPEAVSAIFEVMQQAGGTDCTPEPPSPDRQFDRTVWPLYFRRLGQCSPDGHWLVVITSTEHYLDQRPLVAALYDLRQPWRASPVRRWSLADSGKKSGFAPFLCWMRDSQHLLIVDGNMSAHCVEPLNGLDDGGGGSHPPERAGTRRLETIATETLPHPPPATELGVLKGPDGMSPLHMEHVLLPDGRLLLTVDWKGDSENQIGQVWDASPEKLSLTVSLPFQGSDTGMQFRLSPQGRWLVLTHGSGKPLSGDGACALLFDTADLTAPPRRLLASLEITAAQTQSSSNALGRAWLAPQFGTGVEAEDFVILGHPGHRLMIHSLRATAPDAAIPGVLLSDNPAFLNEFAISPDSRTVMELRWGGDVLVHPLTLSADGTRIEGNPALAIALPGHNDGDAVAFSPDGRWLFATRKHEVHFWKREGLRSGQMPGVLRGNGSFLAHVEVSPDSQTVWSAGTDGRIRRWRFTGIESGLNPQRLPAPGAIVVEAKFSPDGQWVAAGTRGHWTVRNGDPRAAGWLSAGRADGSGLTPLAALGEAATSVAFSPDGKWLAGVGGARAGVWNFPDLAAALTAGNSAPEPVFSSPVEMNPERDSAKLTWVPGNQLHCVHSSRNIGGRDLLWDFNLPDPAAGVRSGKLSRVELPAVASSPDGRWRAVARHGWDPPGYNSEGPRMRREQHGNQVLLFSLNGQADPQVSEHTYVTALPANFVDNTALAFSPDGRWLAAGGQTQAATIWDMHAPDIAASRREVPFVAMQTSAVAFSPDSRRLAVGTGSGTASGMGGGTLCFWEFQNPDPARSLITIPTPEAILSIDWHPDGRLLTAGGGSTVFIWETDLTALIRRARSAAGRELSPLERQRHGL